LTWINGKRAHADDIRIEICQMPLPASELPLREDSPYERTPGLCAACEARHRGICGALDAEQLQDLSRSAHRLVAEEGAEIIGDAERVDHYANVLSGVVKLTKALSDGRQQVVGLRFAPEFLGRLYRTESTINAEAATTVSLCTFPRTTIERLLREQPELERRLFLQALDELDEARNWLVNLGRKTAAEKIASFLLLIARNIDPDAEAEARPAVFDLPLSRADIADFLGLTIETVSRQLTRLRNEGVVHIDNHRHVTVENLGKLEMRSGS
jgi:CRP/FNR family transcriptional regulator